ncbi:16S rRNA (cytidine(1402)-2'-O)-methyltransferase [soil metagenome]
MGSHSRGTLFVVATPIGNQADLSPRARQVLGAADCVAAEDTRHTGRFLSRLGVHAKLVSLHEHNEPRRVAELVARLEAGFDVALVSDAGTPLISDPGYRLLAALREAGLRASPIPGPCAAIAALSVAGLPTDRFVFEGFLPSRHASRRKRLDTLGPEPRTMVFFEAGRRLEDALADMVAAFGAERPAVIARELTKVHETLYHGRLGELAGRAAADRDMQRGEHVIVIGGRVEVAGAHEDARVAATLRILLGELPLAQAVRLTVRLTGARRNDVYRQATDIAFQGR